MDLVLVVAFELVGGHWFDEMAHRMTVEWWKKERYSSPDSLQYG